MSRHPPTDWVELKDYVRILIGQGKRSEHDEFKVLFEVFGKQRITLMAREIMRESYPDGQRDDSVDLNPVSG